jgi:hypothetical protein
MCSVTQLPQVFFSTSNERHLFDSSLLASARHELMASQTYDTTAAFATPQRFLGRESMFKSGTPVPLIRWDGSHNRNWPDLSNSDELEGAVAVHEPLGTSITLRDFSRLVSVGGSPKWRYLGLLFESQMTLYARLCYGRSYCVMNMLERQFSYELVLACIRDPGLSPGLRASFVHLMMHLHVDRHPLYILDMPSLLHVYDAIPSGDAEIRPASTEDPDRLFLLKISILDEITRMILTHSNGSSMSDNKVTPTRTLTIAQLPSFRKSSGTVIAPQGRRGSSLFDMASRRASIDKTGVSFRRASVDLSFKTSLASGSSRTSMLARALSSVKAELDNASPSAQSVSMLTLELLKMTCFLVQAGVFSSLPELTALSEFSAWLFAGPLSLRSVASQSDRRSSTHASASFGGRGEPFSSKFLPNSIVSRCKETLCALLLGVADQWLDYDLRVLLAKLRKAVERNLLKRSDISNDVPSPQRLPFGAKLRRMSDSVGSPARRHSRVHADPGHETTGGSDSNLGSSQTFSASSPPAPQPKKSLAYNRSSAAGFLEVMPEDRECMSIIEDSLASSSVFGSLGSTAMLRILLQLLEERKLFVGVFSLLQDYFNRSERLKRTLGAVHILTFFSPFSQQQGATQIAYENVLAMISRLRKHSEMFVLWGPNLFNPHHKATGESVIEMLQKLAEICDRGKQVSNIPAQDLLRSWHAHTTVLKLLHSVRGGDHDHHELLERIHELCLDLLRIFALENRENQSILFPLVDFLMEQPNKQVKPTLRLLTAIFKSHSLNCTRIRYQSLSTLIGSIRQSGFDPLYLDVLMQLVVDRTDGSSRPLFAQQKVRRHTRACTRVHTGARPPACTYALMQVVLKLLIQHGALLLFNSPSSGDEENSYLERVRLMSEGDDGPAANRLRYHEKLLDLLSMCCESKNTVFEAKCQMLYPCDQVMQALLDAKTILSVRQRLLQYFRNVFLHTDLTNTALVRLLGTSLLTFLQDAAELIEHLYVREFQPKIGHHISDVVAGAVQRESIKIDPANMSETTKVCMRESAVAVHNYVVFALLPAITSLYEGRVLKLLGRAVAASTIDKVAARLSNIVNVLLEVSRLPGEYQLVLLNCKGALRTSVEKGRKLQDVAQRVQATLRNGGSGLPASAQAPILLGSISGPGRGPQSAGGYGKLSRSQGGLQSTSRGSLIVPAAKRHTMVTRPDSEAASYALSFYQPS